MNQKEKSLLETMGFELKALPQGMPTGGTSVWLGLLGIKAAGVDNPISIRRVRLKGGLDEAAEAATT